ncbi:MAG: hypothetical protein ACREBG_19865 [Pyrinomonadaceae bacterium]
MQSQFFRWMALFLTVFITISLCFVDASAQRRKRRTRRVRPVITNPVINPPTSEQAPAAGGERIISTADESADASANADETAQSSETAKKAKPATKASDDQEMQQTINTLSNQVNKLTDKLSQMQENDRSLLDMERLTRAEQRAESLRSQQVEVESKLADLQSRLEVVEYSMKPENIERAQATYGSTRPEEAREARRRQLDNERSRLLAQIKILETSRVRLEGAVATADAEVDLLRRRLEQQRAQEDSSAPPRTESRPSSNRKRPQ